MRTSMSWFNLFRFDDAEDNKGADDKGTGDGGDDAGGKDEFKAITSQKDLDRVLADRLRRQKEQFKDYDDLKTKAAKFDELDAQSKTDLEKAQQAQADAETKAAAALATANGRLIRGEVKGVAGGMKFIDADDAYALVSSDPGKYGDITVDDDGNVIGVKDALEALVAAKPHLVESGKPTGAADGGAKGDGGKTNFREAEKDDLQAELAKHGLRTRT